VEWTEALAGLEATMPLRTAAARQSASGVFFDHFTTEARAESGTAPPARPPCHQPNILTITAIRVSLSIQEHLHAGPLPARVVQGIENLRAKSGFSIFAQKRQGKVPV